MHVATPEGTRPLLQLKVSELCSACLPPHRQMNESLTRKLRNAADCGKSRRVQPCQRLVHTSRYTQTDQVPLLPARILNLFVTRSKRLASHLQQPNPKHPVNVPHQAASCVAIPYTDDDPDSGAVGCVTKFANAHFSSTFNSLFANVFFVTLSLQVREGCSRRQRRSLQVLFYNLLPSLSAQFTSALPHSRSDSRAREEGP